MKLKMDDAGHVVVSDGKPVYVGDDGKDVAFDAPATVATITRLNGEAKGHREAKEAAEAKLKVFDGLDAAAARAAIDKISKIDAKKLVESGDMDAAVQTALKPVQEQLATANKTIETLTGSLSREVIGNAFGRSKFVSDKLTPAGADLIRTLYGDRIKVEDGKVVGYDPNGQKIYSKARPGELADIDEMIETYVESYPHRDHILKGNGGSGTGKKPGDGGGPGGKTISRKEFETLDPVARAGKIKEGFALTD